eukprot:46545-Pelagomonas_calceolata.AAC.1
MITPSANIPTGIPKLDPEELNLGPHALSGPRFIRSALNSGFVLQYSFLPMDPDTKREIVMWSKRGCLQ